MIIRVQSPEGTKRVELKPTDNTKLLYEKVYGALGLASFNFALYQDHSRRHEIVSSAKKTLRSYKLDHGSMIFAFGVNGSLRISEENGIGIAGPSSSSSSSSDMAVTSTSVVLNSAVKGSTNQMASSIKSQVEEDEVDLQLAKEDGRIFRKPNAQLCRHGSMSKCVHCTAFDPWDEEYLKEQNVKHLSFHSYLRKLTSGVDKGKFVSLENLHCQIKLGCKDHPPYPKAVCSKCLPPAITLNRQPYRHVDNVVFENGNLVERFLNYWRVTGHQRLGFLYGHYEPHLDVPLGIKAVVSAIYEPPQEATQDHLKLQPDPRSEVVEEVAHGLSLTCVGWIFTDLVPLDQTSGTVKHVRHADTHFLSAQEVVTAAYLQELHPNPCRLSPEGKFGSKFVTVIVTGDKENQVHMEGYQVSNQCQSLVRDKCLIPTKDVPELAWIRESSERQFVPEVYFKELDQYGNDVVRLGRPLPVEYLLLDCPVSTPVEPIFTFAINEKPFPVANRLVEGHLQDFSALSTYLAAFGEGQFLEAVSDFHFLIFLATMETLPMREYLGPLLVAVRDRDRSLASDWKISDHWATVEQLIVTSGCGGLAEATGGSDVPPGPPMGVVWACVHCTFVNTNVNGVCEICHNPQ